ncbi:MAG: hypothetical protein WBL50_11100, partial [Candidatus Acidiferrum sp.]
AKRTSATLKYNLGLGEVLKPSRVLLLIVFSLLFLALGNSPARAQQFVIPISISRAPQEIAVLNPWAIPAPQDPSQTKPADPKSDPPANGSTIESPQPKSETDTDQTGTQTKRILWIVPNFRSVSANTHLPPQSTKEKFWLATRESFDYSAFIYEGIVAGIAFADKSEPTFGQGAAGYGIYYAHTFADGTIENYLVEAIVPAATKEDPRYYTLGHGGIFKRTGYAVSRLLITRNDAGHDTFNFSEVVGAGAAAGISNLYYPPGNTWVKTYQRWGSQMFQDALSFIAKEYWPDINRAVFHNKY